MEKDMRKKIRSEVRKRLEQKDSVSKDVHPRFCGLVPTACNLLTSLTKKKKKLHYEHKGVNIIYQLQ